MKKVWIYKRTGVNGWWVGWYESSKRKAKALPSKEINDLKMDLAVIWGQKPDFHYGIVGRFSEKTGLILLKTSAMWTRFWYYNQTGRLICATMRLICQMSLSFFAEVER